jgi:hypothetical protein
MLDKTSEDAKHARGDQRTGRSAMKDRLFLFKPNFMDRGKGPYFCPGCVVVEGMLSFYPTLRDQSRSTILISPDPERLWPA